MIKKIISGGQTGGDMGGLLAGNDLGVETGGHCPAAWKTETGYNKYLENFGLICTSTSKYSVRTRLNVQNADLTIGFGDQNSAGMRLTYNACMAFGKPYFPVHLPIFGKGYEYTMDAFGFELEEYDVEILNVAGNRESGHPGIEEEVRKWLIYVLKN